MAVRDDHDEAMPERAGCLTEWVPRRHRLPGDRPPAEVTRWLRDDPHPVALNGAWLSTMAILGSCPLTVAQPDDDAFALLDGQPQLGRSAVRVGGGWIGWLGYRLGREVEELPPDPPAPSPRPRFSLAFYDHVIVRAEDGWWFEELWSPARNAALASRRELWRSRLADRPPAARTVGLSPMRIAGSGAAGHLAAVDECRDRIAAGELFQANLCLRLEGTWEGDPLDLFCAAIDRATPRFGAWVDGVVSVSPERFLRRAGDHVRSDPIKGTRPRFATDEHASEEREALEESAKDAAEHVMIVDLMRNDLGRVCRYGSVQAHERRVEPHAGVWHLVSQVSGTLREGVGDGELLRATFPPGSVTGAPKVQAMKVISELEGTRRELYTGAIGIASPLAGLELSVAIRTFELSGGRIWFGAGGGIVADSDPDLELAEALAKAAGPLHAVGGRTEVASSHPRRPSGVLRALAHGRRPDPCAGVFETILVQDGTAVFLADHLERLEATLTSVFGRELAADLPAQVTRSAAATRGQRTRLRVVATAGGRISVSTVPAPAAADPVVVLTPFVLPGGLGAHKWLDRALLDALRRERPGTVPLLVDADGSVLEAGHANVWIVEGDAQITPPADGRILPGVTRARRLTTEPSAREEPVSLERLQDAGSIFLTSSIAGARPARLAPGLRAGNPAPSTV